MSFYSPSDYPSQVDVILEGLPDGFQAFDREWRYVYLNQRAEEILGRKREDLLGKICWEEYPEAVGTEFHQKYLEALSSGRTVVFESPCPHENTWVEIALHPYPGGLGAFTRDITGRKRAEETLLASMEALRRSEQQYRALFDQVQNAVVLADDDGRYVDANPAACALFDLPCGHLLGRGVFDFVPSGDAGAVKEAWEAFLRQGQASGEFILQRPDGSMRSLEYRAKANVRPGVHLSLLRDVTEQRRAEERASSLLSDLQAERDTLDTINHVGRLLSAELNLERLVQAATDAATELTGAQFGAFFYNVNDASRGGEAYLLYTISGVPREAFSQFPHPRATALFGPTFRAEGVIRSGDITKDPRYGHTAPHFGMPRGHLPLRSYLAVPVVSRSGEVLGGLFFGHAEPDVFTERAERNLVALTGQIAVAMDNSRLFEEAKGSAERYRALFENHPQPMWVFDVETSAILMVNEAASRHYGYSRDEFLRMKISDIGPAVDPPRFREFMPSVGTLPNGKIGIWKHRKKDGTVIDVEVVSSPAHFGGKSARLVAVNDVTERLAAERALRASEQERAALAERQAQLLRQQRAFLKDVLFAVTDGTLILCNSEEELPSYVSSLPGTTDSGAEARLVPLLTASSLRVLRREAQQHASACNLSAEQASDLVTAVSEAAMNVVSHAGGKGEAYAVSDPELESVQIWITDTGPGIPLERLHRAVLERGFTTAGTLGHGFWLMLKTADHVHLLTQEGRGTTVVIEKRRTAPMPEWADRQ